MGTKKKTETLKKILLVDRKPAFADAVCKTLADSGYEVERVEDGEQGLEKVRSYRPDLVISDVFLAHLNGLKLCKILKFDEGFKDIPFILLSSQKAALNELAVEHSGADLLIEKPSGNDGDFFVTLSDRVKDLLKDASQ